MINYELILLIFVLGSLFGWIFEFIVRSIKKEKFVNPGYLKGFYLPIYGTGAVLIYIINLIEINFLVKLLLFGISTTLLELITGLILNQNGISLWKYKKSNSITYKGIICVKCSIMWIFFALIFTNFILPKLLLIELASFIYYISLIILSIIFIDFLNRISK